MHEAGCLCVCLRGTWGTLRLSPRTPCVPPPWWLGRMGHACLWNAHPQILPYCELFRVSSPIKSSLSPMTLPTCVLEPPSHSPRAFCLGWGDTWRGRGLTGPPPPPGGDQPAPASLKSGPSLPRTQKAEEEGSETAPGGGAAVRWPSSFRFLLG